MNYLLSKAFTAEAAIAANRIFKFGAADGGALQGAAATDRLVGVTDTIAIASGERFDGVLNGIADVKLGGTVVRGDPITSDATGQGVVAAPGAGVNNRIIGFAMKSGVAGDIIEVALEPGFMQG